MVDSVGGGGGGLFITFWQIHAVAQVQTLILGENSFATPCSRTGVSMQRAGPDAQPRSFGFAGSGAVSWCMHDYMVYTEHAPKRQQFHVAPAM